MNTLTYKKEAKIPIMIPPLEENEHYTIFNSFRKFYLKIIRVCDKESSLLEISKGVNLAMIVMEQEMKHLSLSDLPERKSTAVVPNGIFWVISKEEYQHYLEIENERIKKQENQENINRTAWERKKDELIREKKRLLSKIDHWNVTKQEGIDENGEYTEYLHTFKIGENFYQLWERSIFDYGIVVTPNYQYKVIDKNIKGMILKIEGKQLWNLGHGENQYNAERKLSEDEKLCLTIVRKFGRFSILS